jgi:DNA-directed RNA polymerase sigma subunit (sigma70/sigma32)
MKRIKYRLAVAYGQSSGIEDAMLRAIARSINDEREPIATQLRGKVCAQNFPPYLPHNSLNGETSVLAPYIRADLQRRQEERDALRQQPLSVEQAKLITDHIPLVRKFAGSIARGDQIVFSELEALGLRTLEEQVRLYVPGTGAPFGAYARYRVRGAMIDHVRANGRTIRVGGMSELKFVSLPKLPRRLTPIDPDEKDIRPTLEVTASGHIRQTHNTPPPKNGIKYYSPSGKLLPTGDMSVIGKLMLKLNSRQQAVYRGRVLTHPPMTRAALARKLGIADETQISRIERQAQRKMTAWLKVSP